MKKIIFLPLLLLALLVFQACTKEASDKTGATPQDQVINATASVSKPYVLNINDLGSVNISKQAVHFEVSSTETNSNEGIHVYKYVPEKGYAGADEVELLSTKTSYSNDGGGCNQGAGSNSPHTYSSRILIKFTVAN